MAHERICMMCGKQYKYCSHCNNYNSKETWKYLFHDENCKDIADVWYAYRGNEITKEEAKERMSVFKPNIDDVLKYTSVACNEIRDIFGVKEEKDAEKVSEENTEKKEIKAENKPKRQVVKRENKE